MQANYVVSLVVSSVNLPLVIWFGPNLKVTLGGHASCTIIQQKGNLSEGEEEQLASMYSFLMMSHQEAGLVLNT